MSKPPVSPAPRPTAGRSALTPAVQAGIAAAFVSVAAMIGIRTLPALEAPIAVGHLLLTALLYATAGALVARLGAAAWRGGLFAGLLDALVGHPIAFLLSTPPDPSRVSLPAGMEPTPSVLASVHLMGAVTAAITAIVLGAIAGAVGGWLSARQRR